MVFYYALALSLGAYSIWIISLSIRLYAKNVLDLQLKKNYTPYKVSQIMVLHWHLSVHLWIRLQSLYPLVLFWFCL